MQLNYKKPATRWTEALPLGNVTLFFQHDVDVQDYQHTLDLTTAISRVHYRIGTVQYTWETFISAPDQILVMQLTCDHPGHLSFTASLDSVLSSYNITRDGHLVLVGAAPSELAPNYQDSPQPIVYGGDAITFQSRLTIGATDGSTMAVSASMGTLRIWTSSALLARSRLASNDRSRRILE